VTTSKKDNFFLTSLLFDLYEICEDITIHALVNIMPIKGDITRVRKKFNLTINTS